MVNQKLVDYIRRQEAKGYSPMQLYQHLIQQGYNPIEVKEAMDFADEPEVSKFLNKKFIMIGIGLAVILIVIVLLIVFFSRLDNAEYKKSDYSGARASSDDADTLAESASDPKSDDLVLEIKFD